MKLFLLTLILLFSGCSETLTRVLPYERENLSSAKMSPEIMSERDGFANEVFGIREGVSLSHGGFSGGCGCK